MLVRGFLAVLMLLCSNAALTKDEINSSLFGSVAIEGIDPVAYFTAGQPTKGNSDFEYEWKGAKWRFSNAEHLELFREDPNRYAPKYGGYCAYAVSQGYTAGIDPDAWSIVDGSLYLNYSLKVQKQWLEMRDAYIEQANKNWPGVLE